MLNQPNPSFCAALRTLAVLLCSLCAAPGHAQTARLTVHVDQPGVKISPSLYGLMTEEINHAYDGGLYAELIQNRAFRDNATTPTHWSLVESGAGVGTIALDNSQAVNAALPTCLRLEAQTAATNQRVGVANEGYWGLPVGPNTRYRASFYAKAAPGFTGPLTATIESADGATTFATASVPALTHDWKQYTLTLNTERVPVSLTNRFVLSVKRPGTVWINLVSLMPPTYKNRVNGNRIDLMQKLAAMRPAFLRFPGGNYLEGNRIAERFDWKTTIGPLDQRPGHQGPWGYRSSDGLGLLEFLGWCEDLKMEPILAVFAGYALGGEHIAAGPELTPFVNDALDEIEYVTGDTNTRWGARRAKDGHPAPFKLRYVEIGNEDNFDRSGSYDGRYKQFYDAIKVKYPKLELIATTGVKSVRPDVLDDHYYRSAQAMARDAGHYDKYDRSGPKIFVGEWASTEGKPTPTLAAALGDAAWMTGMERNSDLILISCYAPLLVNVNPGAAQWGTNLIGYDALTSFGSPSYYVQSLFAANRGDTVLPVEITQPAPKTPVAAFVPTGGIGVGTWRTQADYKEITVKEGTGAETAFLRDGVDDRWKIGRGKWVIENGVMAQKTEETNCLATVGDVRWTDYTYHVKARKAAGAEGFLILFHAQNEANYLQWNIGGWGNTRTAIQRYHNGEQYEIGPVSSVGIETGKWYDIRVEVKGTHVACYLDDKLITEAEDVSAPPANPLYATACRDIRTGEIILKVVNMSADVVPLTIDLEGIKKIVGAGKGQVVAGELLDQNTLTEPLKVAPKPFTLTANGQTLTQSFPAYSVSVFRVKVQ